MNHVFYHSRDLDGHCSGALMRLSFERWPSDFRMHPADYGDDLSTDGIHSRDWVYFLDFVPQPAVFLDILTDEIGAVVVILDHHKTSAPLADKYYGKIQPDNSLAACELVSDYCFSRVYEFVRLLGIYDTWRKDAASWDGLVLPFQYGMRSYETDPATEEGMTIWRELFKQAQTGILMPGPTRPTVDSIRQVGEGILRYQAKQDRAKMKGAFEVTFEGLRAIACAGGGSSLAFQSVWDPARHDLMLSYSNVRGKYWTVSLYTDKPGLDLSPLAKKWGGGGHAQACGFQVNDIQDVLEPDRPKPVCACGGKCRKDVTVRVDTIDLQLSMS
jgi:hypothetical protein